MPKIVRNEIEYSSTTSTANQIQYNNTTSGLSATNVQGAIDEVDGLIPNWIKQAAGTSLSLILPCMFFYYYADQWTAYVQLPFVAKNTNYTITLNDVIAENIGSIVSKCSVVDKQYGYFSIRTTKTMPSLPDVYSVCGGRCRFTITFV